MINMVFKKISHYVIPAKAGIQNLWKTLDSRFRGNDRLILPLVILIVATVACGDSNDGGPDPFDPNAYFDDSPPDDGGAPVKECVTDLQCIGGKLCVAGKCFTPSDKKPEDSDKKKACVINFDCSAGEKCNAGICQKTSSSDSGSSSGGGGKSKKKNSDNDKGDENDGADDLDGGDDIDSQNACTSSKQCQNMYSTPYAYCIQNECVNYAEKWACLVYSDCASGEYCHPKEKICVSQLAVKYDPVVDSSYDVDPKSIFIGKLDGEVEQKTGIVGDEKAALNPHRCNSVEEYPVGLKVWYNSDKITGLRLACKDAFTGKITYGDLVGNDQSQKFSEEICVDGDNGIGVWAGIFLVTDSTTIKSLQIYCGVADLKIGFVNFGNNHPNTYGQCLGAFVPDQQPFEGKCWGESGKLPKPVPGANGSGGDTVIAGYYEKHEFNFALQNALITGIMAQADQANVTSFGLMYKTLGTKSWSNENDDDYLALSEYLDTVETSYLKPLGDYEDPDKNKNLGYDAKCPAGMYPTGFRLYGQDPKKGLWLGAIGPFQLLCQHPGDFSAKADPKVHIFDNDVLDEMNYVFDTVCPTNPYKGPGVLVGLRIRRLYTKVITWQNLCGYIDLKTWKVVVDKTSKDYYGECIGHGDNVAKVACMDMTYDGPGVAPNTTQHTLLVPANALITQVKGWAGYGGLGQIHLGYKKLTN